MDEPIPLHLVAPPGDRRERLAGALGNFRLALHDSLESFRAGAGRGRQDVVVDVPVGVSVEPFHDLCRAIADQELEWTILVPEGDLESEIAFRPFSAGFPVAAAELPAVLDEEGDAGPPFDLHRILRIVARVRHDINNPLTAGLAEAQLLLMDLGDGGEVGESLETIHRQLQRIRELVRRLTPLRVPSRDSGPSR